MLEKTLERKLVQKIKALGGMCEKFVSPQRRGVPDRIVTLPGGKIIFVEMKKPGKKPTKLQMVDHEQRKKLGCNVVVIDSEEKINEFPGLFA